MRFASGVSNPSCKTAVRASFKPESKSISFCRRLCIHSIAKSCYGRFFATNIAIMQSLVTPTPIGSRWNTIRGGCKTKLMPVGSGWTSRRLWSPHRVVPARQARFRQPRRRLPDRRPRRRFSACNQKKLRGTQFPGRGFEFDMGLRPTPTVQRRKHGHEPKWRFLEIFQSRILPRFGAPD